MSARYAAIDATVDGLDVLADATLIIETEMIETTSMVKVTPNPKWSFTDSARHFHAFSGDDLPTLEPDVIEHGCGDPECCEESWVETIYRCRICREVIEPQYINSYPVLREFIPGRKSWRLEFRAVGSGANLMHEKIKTQVSVRVTDDQSDQEFFGIGVMIIDSMSMSRSVHPGDADYAVASGTIMGLGALGMRRKK